MNKLKYKLALVLLKAGIRAIPNPFVRQRFQMGLDAAAETVIWENSRDDQRYEQSMAD